MKQVGRYSRFLFSIIFRRWSYYVSTIVYLLVLAAILFLVSAVLHRPVARTLSLFGFNMMVILAGSITAAVYSVQLFRAGIDDGTELLITAKPIKRNELLAGKCIVLLTLILIVSFISMCMGFLTYYTIDGDLTYTYIGAGSFIVTLLIMLFFSGVSIIFCLVTKKMGATLGTIGVCFAFMMYCFADTILSKGPANYVDNKNLELKIVNPVTSIEKDEKTNEYVFNTKSGGIAQSSITKNAIIDYLEIDGKKVPNSQYLYNLWHHALIGTSRYSMLVLDPIFQWSTLLNLQNYILDIYQLGPYYQYTFVHDYMSNNNLKFGDKLVDLSQFVNCDITFDGVNGTSSNYILLKNNNLVVTLANNTIPYTDAVSNSLEDKILIPEFNLNPLNSTETEINKKNNFSISKTSWSTINDYFFTNQPNAKRSIVDEIKCNFETLVKHNLLSNMKIINTISCIQTYLISGFIDALSNKEFFNEMSQYVQEQDLGFELININEPKEIIKFFSSKESKNVFKTILFINKIALNSLAQIQTIAYNYLSSNDVDKTSAMYQNAKELVNINSIIPTISGNYAVFTMPYWLLNGFVEIANGNNHSPYNNLYISSNNNEVAKQLIKVINSCFINFNAPPLEATNNINLTTFNTVKIVPYISLGGMLAVWFSLTSILLVIGTILYSRKDFV